MLCHALDRDVQPLFALADAAGCDWDILALTRGAASGAFSGTLRARCLLLPGDSAPSLVHTLHALQIVAYGFSPRDTLTLSSVTGAERLVCLQRSLLTLGGTLLEPQELPLPPALSSLDAEQALLAAGISLLRCGKVS